MVKSNKKLLFFILAPISILGILLTTFIIVGTGNKTYVVFSDSMIPNLNTGDIVIVAKKDLDSSTNFANLKVGEIIVFAPPSGTTPDKDLAKTIIHRVVEIETDSSGARVIRTKGDANTHSIQALDYPITTENYIGKVVYVVRYLGLLLMYFDLLIRVLIQPIFYIIIGAIITVIFIMEWRKRQIVLKNLHE